MDSSPGMTCLRCHGLMVERPCCERDWRAVAMGLRQAISLWSCTNCGECLDETILYHRQMQAARVERERHAKLWEEILRQWKAVAL